MTSLNDAKFNNKDKRKSKKLGYVINDVQIEEVSAEEIIIEKPKKKNLKKRLYEFSN